MGIRAPKIGQRKADLWDRRAVAKFCRVSVGCVRYMEKQGLIRSEFRDANGVYWYEPQHIRDAQLKRRKSRSNESRRAGALHAAVFGKLRDGLSIRDIVIELGEPFEVVQELAQKWRGDGADQTVPGEVCTELERLLDEAGYRLVWRDMPNHVEHWLELERAEAARKLSASARAAKAKGRPKTLRGVRRAPHESGQRKVQAR